MHSHVESFYTEVRRVLALRQLKERGCSGTQSHGQLRQ